MTFDSVGVIGGGAWGTALAQTLRLAGRDVRLWAREPEVVAEINAQPRQLGVPAGRGARSGPASATTELAEIAAQDVVLMVAPAQHVRAVAARARPAPAGGQAGRHLRQGPGAGDRQAAGRGARRDDPARDPGRAVGPELRRRRGARPARGPHPRHCRRGARAGAGDRARLPRTCASTGRATRRRAARRRGEERAGHRRRHRRRQRAGRQRARGPRHARLCRAAPLRRGAGRARPKR